MNENLEQKPSILLPDHFDRLSLALRGYQMQMGQMASRSQMGVLHLPFRME